MSPTFNFKHTTHDRTICQIIFKGNNVLLLWIVNDLLIQCKREETAWEVYTLIGFALYLENEDELPFAYLGPCFDFNGVNIEQSNTHIMISCQSYIDQMLCWWNNNKKKPLKNISPLSDSCPKTIFQECGPDEGTINAFKLEFSQGFGYHTLLGEMMYVYVTRHPDIGYAITFMSKFSTKPPKSHYKLIKGITKYLRETKDWGMIKYTQPFAIDDLAPATLTSNVVYDESLFAFPVDINQPKLIAFVDVVYANNQRKRQSTTSFVITYCGGAIVYQSKTRSITTISLLKLSFLLQYLAQRLPHIYNLFYMNLVLNAKSQLLSTKTMCPPS